VKKLLAVMIIGGLFSLGCQDTGKPEPKKEKGTTPTNVAKPKDNATKPKDDGAKPKDDGAKPKDDGAKPKDDGAKPKNDATKDKDKKKN